MNVAGQAAQPSVGYSAIGNHISHRIMLRHVWRVYDKGMGVVSRRSQAPMHPVSSAMQGWQSATVCFADAHADCFSCIQGAVVSRHSHEGHTQALQGTSDCQLRLVC